MLLFTEKSLKLTHNYSFLKKQEKENWSRQVAKEPGVCTVCSES